MYEDTKEVKVFRPTAEDNKQTVLNFLVENAGKKFRIRQVAQQIQKISYPTVLKWVTVLAGERKIIVEDYGSVKLVYYDAGKESSE